MSTSPVEDSALSFEAAADRLTELFERWCPGSPDWTDEIMDGWARLAFRIQYSENDPYRRYCDARNIGPAAVEGWRDVPPVPTAAFRAVDLIVGKRTDETLLFRTSGTTRGRDRRGRHLVRRPELYRASLRSAFQHFVLGGETAARIITLLPTFTTDRDSSLGWMLDDVREGLGAAGSRSVAGAYGIDWAALVRALEEARDAGSPVCLLGTTASFDAWRAWLDGARAELPSVAATSRLMDTGGTKGRPGLVREELMLDLVARLGLGTEALVNEFGMTELLSQRYARGATPDPLVGPPWLRTRVLDPVSLAELPDGEVGILCHFDLANLGSVCAVLTEDRGRRSDGGIEWLGRTSGAPPRGCSLATAQLLEAQNED